MLPLLTFASGLLAGAVGVRLLKTVKPPERLRTAAGVRLESLGDKTRHGFDKAETGLRQATISGLEVVEKSSASLRAKLTPTASETVSESSPPETVEVPVETKAAAKPKRRAPRKKAASVDASVAETETGS